MVYLESPANPTCKISDICSISTLCKEKGAKLVVDGTFTTPYFIKPLELGADISLHSITKYMNGHGFLEKHPKIKKVYHPWLDSFLGHEMAIKQMKGCGSTFSFEMNSFEAAKKLMECLKICTLAVSLGTLDTLIEHPASMTHAAVPEELMRKQGITPELVRISVGIENVDDIIADLEQALDKC